MYAYVNTLDKHGELVKLDSKATRCSISIVSLDTSFRTSPFWLG